MRKIAQSLRTRLDNAVGFRDFNQIGIGTHRAQAAGSMPPWSLRSQSATSILGRSHGKPHRCQRTHPRKAAFKLSIASGVSDGSRWRNKTIAVEVNGQSFSSVLRCDAPGTHRLEVMGEADAGPVVLANIPVYCGIKAPTSVRLIADTAGKLTVSEAEERIFELLNSARIRSGRPPLINHAKAAEVARAHSEDMRDNRFVAHISRRSGGVDDRMEKAGIRVSWLAENLGLAGTPDGVHEGLMESPGHRNTILSTQASHIGIGAAFDRDGDLLDNAGFSQADDAPRGGCRSKGNHRANDRAENGSRSRPTLEWRRSPAISPRCTCEEIWPPKKLPLRPAEDCARRSQRVPRISDSGQFNPPACHHSQC